MSRGHTWPSEPLPCDFCNATPAPFGFAPAPHLVRVPRPIWTCSAQACKDKAAARVAAALDKNDPLLRALERHKAMVAARDQAAPEPPPLPPDDLFSVID